VRSSSRADNGARPLPARAGAANGRPPLALLFVLVAGRSPRPPL